MLIHRFLSWMKVKTKVLLLCYDRFMLYLGQDFNDECTMPILRDTIVAGIFEWIYKDRDEILSGLLVEIWFPSENQYSFNTHDSCLVYL